jgi:hypothetical protein
MGWSQSRLVAAAQQYSDEVAVIDKMMLKLYADRRALTGKKRFFPPREWLVGQGEELGLEIDVVSRFLHSLNEHVPITSPRQETPIGVLSIMRRATAMDCEFVITHALQYESYSSLAVEVSLQGDESENAHLRPMLDLVVIGGEMEYAASNFGSSGGVMHAQMRFQISPRLPDDLSGVVLSLVPGAHRSHPQPRELKLDRQVDFV